MKILSLSTVFVLAINLSGCSHFIIHEEDSVPLIAAKVSGRTFGCLLTLIYGCISEWGKMASLKAAEEANTPAVTASGSLPGRGVPQRIVVWSNHQSIVGAVIEDFQTQGQTVLERSRMEALLREQQVRLTYSSDSEADLLKVGKLIGADAVVIAEATSTTVTMRGVAIETGEIQWTSTARFPGAFSQPDSGLVVLTKAALARARCPLSQGARWSNRRGCLVGE